jgi:hypothetical protein
MKIRFWLLSLTISAICLAGNNINSDSIFLPDRVAFLETDSNGAFISKVEFRFSEYGFIKLGKKNKIAVDARYYNENDREVMKDTFSIALSEDTYKISPSMLLNFRSSSSSVSIKQTGGKIAFPTNPIVGNSIDDEDIKYKVFSGSTKLFESQIEFKNRKVKSVETLNVLGQNVTDCYLIQNKLEITTKMKKSVKGKKCKPEDDTEEEDKENRRLNVWFSKSYGFLKIEERNAKGRVIRKMDFIRD